MELSYNMTSLPCIHTVEVRCLTCMLNTVAFVKMFVVH